LRILPTRVSIKYTLEINSSIFGASLSREIRAYFKILFDDNVDLIRSEVGHETNREFSYHEKKVSISLRETGRRMDARHTFHSSWNDGLRTRSRESSLDSVNAETYRGYFDEISGG
jgi:hypothetical protein